MPGTEPGHFHFGVDDRFHETFMTGVMDLNYDEKSQIVFAKISGLITREAALDLSWRLVTCIKDNPCIGVLSDVRKVRHDYDAGEVFGVLDRVAANKPDRFKYAVLIHEMDMERYQAAAIYIGDCMNMRVFTSFSEAETWLSVGR